MIFGRPLKNVLGKIIPFGKNETIHTENLGTGTSDGTKFLKDDGVWSLIHSSSVIQSQRSVTTTTTTALIDDIIFCNGTFTVNISTAIGMTKDITIVNIGTGIITLDPFSSQTISGETTFDIYEGESATLSSDGANLFLIC